MSSREPSSDVDRSSPGPGQLKKQRVSAFDSDEDEESAVATGALKKRISRFKKPATPKKARRSNAASSDNDSDFMPVPEESDNDVVVPVTSSRRGSSVSRSELDSTAAEDDSEMSDVPKLKQAKRASMPSMTKGKSSERGGSSFLTAAEQREKNKKIEKKTGEDPFEFLRDVRDVSNHFWRIW